MNSNDKIKTVSEQTGISVKELNRLNQDLFNPYETLFVKLGQYKYCNFPKYNNDFAKFVLDNRTQNRNMTIHHYDLIWGVMSDSIPDQVIWNYKNGIISYDEAIEKFKKCNSMKQLFLSNQTLCDMLMINNIYFKEEKQYA